MTAVFNNETENCLYGSVLFGRFIGKIHKMKICIP